MAKMQLGRPEEKNPVPTVTDVGDVVEVLGGPEPVQSEAHPGSVVEATVDVAEEGEFPEEEAPAASPKDEAAVEQKDEPKRTLVERLARGEAIKTSLYLDRSIHRELKLAAAELSYGMDTGGRIHGAVSAQDLILLGIGMVLQALGREGVVGDCSLLEIER